jgi:nitroreductase
MSIGQTVLQQLSWRYATKVFDATRKISADDWKTLETAMIHAPSSFGLQPWKFMVVTTQSVKDQLPEAAWGQSQPRDCSHFVVIAARKTTDPDYVQKFIDTSATVQGVPVSALDGYKQAILGKTTGMKNGHLEWNSRQCYIALGFLLETAAMMGIDACPMEGIVRDKVDELLGLSGGEYTSTVACALGYRSSQDKYASARKVRYSSSDVVQYI